MGPGLRDRRWLRHRVDRPASPGAVESATIVTISTGRVRLHILPYVGNRRLTSIDAGVLNGLYAQLLESGNRRDEGGLSRRSVNYIHSILHRAFRDAVRWGRIRSSPADASDPPAASRSDRTEIQTWDSSNLSGFLAKALEADDEHWTLWLVLASTGMRRGEALGLRWSDLDLKAGSAGVRQTVIAVNHEIQFGTPKTGRGRRNVSLDSRTVRALKAHRAHQAEIRMQLGTAWADLDLVFTETSGGPLHPESISKCFTRRVEKWELPRLSLHGLRHTWATLALGSGIHPRIVQERLGHATIAVTLDTYSHVTAGMQDDAAERVAQLFL